MTRTLSTRKRSGRRMRCLDHEPGEERHQSGKRNREPVGPYVIRYPRREWTHHRKVTSPGHRISSAEHRRLSPHSAEIPSPGRVRPMKRPLFGAVASRPTPVVCAYDHLAGGSKHNRRIDHRHSPSFVPTATPQVVLSTNDGEWRSILFHLTAICGTFAT